MNVLVVGSSIIDLFLEVQDKNRITTDGNNVSLKLGDKIPIDIKKIATGGDGANVSVGLQRLSINTVFYTFFGTDLFSKEIQEKMREEKIKLIAENSGEKTSLSLIFDFDSDRIIFSHREERQHNFNYREENLPDFIYLSSIGDKWEDAYLSVLEFIKKNNIPFAFTPGTPQLRRQTDILFNVLKQAKIVLLNRDEAERILKFKNISYSDDIKDVLSKFKSFGMEILSVTDGMKGAYSVDSSGKVYFIKPFGEKSVERTGAGDAYTSGFLAKYLTGADIQECMRWGPANANSVTQKTGAQEGLLTLEQMEKILSEHPGFRTEEI